MSAATTSAGRRTEVLAVVRSAAAPLTIPQIARELRVHPNTVRFHLDRLVADGLVEHVAPDHRRPGRPPLMFRAVRRMDPGGPRRYRMLAEILALSLAGDRNATAKALEAGRAWGRNQGSAIQTSKAPVEQLVDLLDELGFSPERRAGQPEVGLRHCPFLELAEHRSDLVCPIHLGLMQGALETWDASVTVERLDAFVEPDLCLARLAPKGSTR